MTPTIRSATTADLAQIAKFQLGIVAAEIPMDPSLDPETGAYYDIAELHGDPDTQLIVAQVGGVLAGCCFGQLRPAKPWNIPDRLGYIGMVYVAPEYRGQGLCPRMIEVLEAWFCARGVLELRLEVYDSNAAALSGYQKRGFTPLLVQMRKSLALV